MPTPESKIERAALTIFKEENTEGYVFVEDFQFLMGSVVKLVLGKVPLIWHTDTGQIEIVGSGISEEKK